MLAARASALAILVAASGCSDSAKTSREQESRADGGLDASTSQSRPDAGGPASADAETAEGGSDAALARKYVTVRFRAEVGGEPFACDRSYPGIGTTAVEVVPSDLRLFVQDVALVRKDDGKVVPLELDAREGVQTPGVTLLDFENGKGSCVRVGGTERTNTVVTGWVPEGDYEGVVFSNGVPLELNHQNPIDLMPPLVAGPLHWNWNGGFLFINAQLREKRASMGSGDGGVVGGQDAGAVDAGPPDPVGSAVLHIGSNLCAPTSDGHACGKPNRNRVVLSPFDPTKNEIVLDIAALFATVDLTDTTTCHAVGVECLQFFPAIGIDYETGKPTKTQTIYHVE